MSFDALFSLSLAVYTGFCVVTFPVFLACEFFFGVPREHRFTLPWFFRLARSVMLWVVVCPFWCVVAIRHYLATPTRGEDSDRKSE